MPRKKRLFVIIHLVLALLYLTWVACQPKLLEIASRKGRLLLFESIIQNKPLFATLDNNLQKELISHAKLAEKTGPLLFSFSFLGLCWAFLSITLALLLLFSSKNVALLCWLLPMLVLPYGFFIASGSSTREYPDFFPTKELLASYMSEGKKGRARVIDGWNHYLIATWLKETPTEERYAEQMSRGNFLFNVERAKWLMAEKKGDVLFVHSLFTPSLFQLIFYFIWNLLFAWTINLRPSTQREHSH